MAIQFWYLLFFARESTFVTLFTAFTNFIVIYCFANWSILSLLVAVVVAALQSPHAASSRVVLEHALRAFVNLGFINHFDRSDKTVCAGACSAAAERIHVWLCVRVCGGRGESFSEWRLQLQPASVCTDYTRGSIDSCDQLVIFSEPIVDSLWCDAKLSDHHLFVCLQRWSPRFGPPMQHRVLLWLDMVWRRSIASPTKMMATPPS